MGMYDEIFSHLVNRRSSTIKQEIRWRSLFAVGVKA